MKYEMAKNMKLTKKEWFENKNIILKRIKE